MVTGGCHHISYIRRQFHDIVNDKCKPKFGTFILLLYICNHWLQNLITLWTHCVHNLLSVFLGSKNKELGIFFVMLLRQVMCFATKRTHCSNWCRKYGLKILLWLTSILSQTYLLPTSNLTQKYLMVIIYLPHICVRLLHSSCTVKHCTTTVQVQNR